MEMTKRILMVAGIAFVILILAVLIAPSDKTVVSPVPTVTVEPTRAIDVLEAEYMKGCTGEGANSRYCQCSYDYLVAKVGIDGIVREGIEYMETEEFTPNMVEAAVECSDLY